MYFDARLIPFVAFVLCFLPAVQSQPGGAHEMAFYADAMVNASRPVHRMQAANEFYRLFTGYINTPDSHMGFIDELPWVTAVYPADSTFRVITWQVEEEQHYRYYGFIQFIDDSGRGPIELHDNRSLNSEFAMFNQDTWYGAIYYGIQPFRTPDRKDAYLLLGFNAHTKSLNQRVADVLSIGSGEITFGLPVFTAEETTDAMSRVIVEYADAASATMRFDREKELLIFDHMIPLDTPEGPTLVPDGSYHGYKYKKGKWIFIDKVFDVIVDEPPGGRAPEKVKKDLFGREVEKNE